MNAAPLIKQQVIGLLTIRLGQLKHHVKKNLYWHRGGGSKENEKKEMKILN